MTRTVFVNIFRFLGLVLIQGFILKNLLMIWEGLSYLNILIYPLFIILLPLRTPKPAVILLAFLMGISVDLFYDSPGVHASACVFSAFARPFFLGRFEPRGGFNVNFSPTMKRMGFRNFFGYAALFMGAHLFFYYSVEAFTFAYISSILWKTLFTFLSSMFLVFILMILFNPVD